MVEPQQRNAGDHAGGARFLNTHGSGSREIREPQDRLAGGQRQLNSILEMIKKRGARQAFLVGSSGNFRSFLNLTGGCGERVEPLQEDSEI